MNETIVILFAFGAAEIACIIGLIVATFREKKNGKNQRITALSATGYAEKGGRGIDEDRWILL